MNIQMNGAARRPTLSPAYGANRGGHRPPAAAPATLPTHEVRRLVAGMIG